MTLANEFKVVRSDNGVTVNMKRSGNTAWFMCEWVRPTKDGQYETFKGDMLESFIEMKIADGTYFLLADPRYSELPSRFYFTTSSGKRYTGYVNDDFVVVSFGSGIATETTTYPLSVVWDFINDGHWKVLPESYRSPSSVAAEFMEYITKQGEIVAEEDRMALAQTIVLLNKVMYDRVSGIDA